MQKIIIPSQVNKDWLINYGEEYRGHIIDAFNIDAHSKRGKISHGYRAFPHTTSTDSATMVYAVDFIYSDTDGTAKFWALTNKLWNTGSYASVFTADTLTNSPTSITQGDLEIYGKSSGGFDKLLCGTSTNIARFNRDVSTTTWTTGWWQTTLGQSALNGSYPHPMEVSEDVLFIGDDNFIHIVLTSNEPTSADVLYKKLTFNVGYYVSWIKATKNNIYIGLANKKGNGFGSQIAEYDYYNDRLRIIEYKEVGTIGFIYNNEIFVIDGRGYIKQFMGNYFKTIKRFPISFVYGSYMTLPHRNGIAVIEDLIKFNIPSNQFYNGQYSGIWTFEPETQKLYHETSFTYVKSSANGSGESSTTNDVGALYPIGQSTGFYFAGANVNTSFDSSIGGIFAIPLNIGSAGGSNRCNFTTQKIPAGTRSANFTKLIIKYDPSLNTGSQTGTIIAKYRIKNPTFNSQTTDKGTWLTSTTFTALSLVSGVAVGDEITILKGHGSGHIAHITNINGTTITIDEAFSGFTATNTFIYGVNNWKKIEPTGTDNSLHSIVYPIPAGEAEWIQFKIAMIGEFAIDELQIEYNNNSN